MTTLTTNGTVTPEQLRVWLDDGADVRVLDVRTPAEYESVHIPGSYNVPLDTLGEHAHELRRNLDVPVVLVCRSGARASQAEQRLAAAGMERLQVLQGGIERWQRLGGEVRRGRQRWGLERQVRLVAGLLVLAGLAGGTRVPRLRLLSAAVGTGLTSSALLDSCMLANLLAKLPYNTPASCDIDTVVAELIAA